MTITDSTSTIIHDADGTGMAGVTLEEAFRMSKAAAAWACRGFPKRSDSEVDRIFREHCAVCPLFQNATCTHKGCGCQVRDVNGEMESFVGRWISTALANKLRWATEHCPIGLW